MNFAFEEMKKLDFVKTYTTEDENRCPVIAFNVKDAHPLGNALLFFQKRSSH